jgi:2-polyprenyl-3-methyl-5-hydroxy-6-metoxy-1,4-benzoquinol methylase
MGVPQSKSADDPIAYFDRLAGSYSDWTMESGAFHERLDVFRHLIDQSRDEAPTDLAVDLGCGNGQLTKLLHAAGFRVIGIDGSQEMMARAQSLLGDAAGVEFRGEALPLRPAVVDELRGKVGLLVASSVIEYLSDDRLFLEQCRELTAPGGSALVSFANASSLYRRYERAVGPRGPQRGKIIEVQQRQHSQHDVEALGRRVGLDVANALYFGIPLRRPLGRFVRRRPPWLATLLLVRFQRP